VITVPSYLTSFDKCRYVLKSKFLYVSQSTVRLRFIKFTLLATGQPVYGIECERVNFVLRANGFPLFLQIVRTYTSTARKGITPHCMSKCFIDVSDGIYQPVMTNGSASRPESNLYEIFFAENITYGGRWTLRC